MVPAAVFVTWWLLAGTKAALSWWQIDAWDVGSGTSVTAAARVIDRHDHLKVADLVARPSGSGTGAALIEHIQQEAARRSLPVELTAANHNIAEWYQNRLGFEQRGAPGRFRVLLRWSPPTY